MKLPKVYKRKALVRGLISLWICSILIPTVAVFIAMGLFVFGLFEIWRAFQPEDDGVE